MDRSNALVVDASVAVKWHLIDEEHAEPALALLTGLLQGQIGLLAPDYIRYEVPAAISVATRARPPRLTVDEGRAAIQEFLDIPLTTRDSEGLIVEAYPLVHRYGCALYDALYVALAERLALPFVTADRRLYQRIRHIPRIIWIAGYGPRQPT